jgi:hypothetical protein
MSFLGTRTLLGLALVTGLVWAAAPDDAAGQKTTTATTSKAQTNAQQHPYPHIHAALHDLKKARHELHEAKHDFGGRREQALKAVDHAIHELEGILNHVPHNGNGTAATSSTSKKS